jgi:UDP-N-acetylglucosamine/UDP-N-acetylgalactosamine diphosphorylase
MELTPACHTKIVALMDKGVHIPNPSTLDIGDEVQVDRISGDNVTIFPGCRIYGERTVISRGTRVGYEGPVTIDNCQLGPEVELKAGYFAEAVFLEKASMALGAHVREGTLLEEEANGAHCVGLKQTILFPFVTLGSLINFCDCLMAGGTSRKDHSEVGSSYIHFNFTPDGDKTTSSLIGDVPRGVMLNQRPIFLGGQGGMVGPLRLGYGNVVAAGTILRNDILEDDRLITGKSHRGKVMDHVPYRYMNLGHIVANNIIYLANLVALEHWYRDVRRPFFEAQELGIGVYEGALASLASAKTERIKRLRAMAEKMPASLKLTPPGTAAARRKQEFHDRIDEVCGLFTGDGLAGPAEAHRERFLTPMDTHRQTAGNNYITTIKSLPADIARTGTEWLQGIVDAHCARTAELLPTLQLFG